MTVRMKVTPRFNTREIMDTTVNKDIKKFRENSMKLGKQLHNYMLSFISSHHKRAGATGNLANSVNYEEFKGRNRFGWGIGNIELLMQKAPYYYVINYGKKVTGEPFAPPVRPVQYTDGPADPEKAGVGNAKATAFAKGESSIVRPMGYIQATVARFNAKLRSLITSIKRG